MLAWNAATARTFFQGLVLTVIASGCSGGGCSGCGMEPMPGGFPEASRTSNAIQLRVTESAIATLEADPAGLVGPLLAQGGLTFDVPPSCGADPKICCNSGTPDATCGPVEIDLVEQPGDAPRLEVTPVQGSQRIDLIIRARMKSTMPIPVSYQGIKCLVSIDTAGGVRDGITVTMDINLPQDVDENTTRMEVGSSNVDFENDDITIGGGFLCGTIDTFLKGAIVDNLTNTLNDTIASSVEDQACVACASGTTAECGSFADSCQSGLCMIGTRCEQRIGISGRMPASGIFGGISSGQLGNMDIYDVAGGITETDNNGITSSMYSGALSFAEPRDRCGPSAAKPVPLSDIAQSSYFTGNTRPDTGATFDVGIGVHQQALDHLAYASYESGSLCLNISPSTVDLLNTDGLGPLLMPSVIDFLHGKNSPIVLGLRPQSPPTITIGAGTSMVDGNGETVIIEPLLDILFNDIEIDFSVVVDQQFIRMMTLTADIHLPVNLDINELGEIVPVLGSPDNAISNPRISNSEPLSETDSELEEKVPVLISLALPSLLGGLGSFALPSLGGLNIQIANDGILSIENNDFLAIFADLVPTTASPRVESEATLSVVRDGVVPVARISLGGNTRERDIWCLAQEKRGDVSAKGPCSLDSTFLEYSFQVDGGVWAPYTRESELYLRRDIFALPGEHSINVRARLHGLPLSADLSPVSLRARFVSDVGSSNFHGKSSGQGCACDSGGSAASSMWLVGLVFLLLLVKRRPYGNLLAALALASLSGCTCSSDPVEACPGGCMDGGVKPGIIGRYSSLAASPTRIVAAAYDEKLGDLVLVERNQEGSLDFTAIAGIPNAPPTYDPGTYRGGVAGRGPDQGIWTSIALYQDRIVVAYVDAEDGSVHLAREQEDGSFLSELVDAEVGVSGASYLSLSISSSGDPSIAYLAHGLPSPDNDGLISELRVADGANQWNTQVVDEEPISCGGLCADSEVCVEASGVQECKAPSGTCATACVDTEACIAGTCEPIIEGSVAAELVDGVGLFANLVRLGDDSMVLGYYDSTLGTLKIASSRGTGFTSVTAYEDPQLDTGRWLSMVVGNDDTVHLAFQDATGDRLMYATLSGGTLSAPEFVDSGVRMGDFRTHPVGASAAIALNQNRAPTIVYQDGLNADVLIASKSGGSWQRTPFMTGARVDGFFVHVASDGERSWMSHYFYDRAAIPIGELEIVALP